MKLTVFILLVLLFTQNILYSQSNKPQICFTFDDGYPRGNYLFSSTDGNKMVLNHLDNFGLKGAFFVKADILQTETGKEIVDEWNRRGHMICNHSYTHKNYHSENVSIQEYAEDFLRADSALSVFSGFRKLYRYPMLREGNTIEKRDSFRKLLEELEYKIGYVTIDNTEWVINSRLQSKLTKNEKVDLELYKTIYIEHLFDLALKYDSLALNITGKRIPQIMLVHNNITSALFLGELIAKFIDNGWDVIDASKAFEDQVYECKPDVIWQRGQSLLFSLAREKTLLDEGETFNLEAEKVLLEKMDKLGL